MQVSSCSNVNFKSVFIIPRSKVVGEFTTATAKRMLYTFPNPSVASSKSRILVDSGGENIKGNPNDISTFNMILNELLGRKDFVNTISQVISKAKELGIEFHPEKSLYSMGHTVKGRWD